MRGSTGPPPRAGTTDSALGRFGGGGSAGGVEASRGWWPPIPGTPRAAYPPRPSSFPPPPTLAFPTDPRPAFPSPIRRLQCDHGKESSFAFVRGGEAAGIRPGYIRPRRPQQNGKVERSHRIDQEEFWGRQRFPDFEAAAAALRGWETRYNYERFSLALQGRTPAEKLAALQPPRRAPYASPAPRPPRTH